MGETIDSGAPQVSSPSAKAGGDANVLDDLQRRGAPIVDALAQAVAHDLVGRAAHPVTPVDGAGACCDLGEIQGLQRDAAEVFHIGIRKDNIPTGRMSLLIADHSATALARLALPEIGERSPQRIAEALRESAERSAAAIARLLRLRSDARLSAWIPPSEVVDESEETEDQDPHWLRRSVLLHAEGLEDICLQLAVSAHTILLIADCWRGAATIDAPRSTPLPCFLGDDSSFELVATAARQVGFLAERRPPGEAPNPRASDQGILVLDIPVGQERRFAWCQRIKQRCHDLQVLVLLHHPSKARVLRACLAHADEILGWPAEQGRIADRLRLLQRRERENRTG